MQSTSRPAFAAMAAFTLACLLGFAFAGAALAQGPPDDPGFVQIRGASYPIAEEAGEVLVIVRRHRGTTGEVSIDYNTVDGSAIDGEDYTATSGTLTWADGDGSDQTITIPILDDDADEGLETFGIVLSNPTGGVGLGAVSSAIVRILPSDRGDDEPGDDEPGDDEPGDDEEEEDRVKLRSAVFPSFESAGEAVFVIVRKGNASDAASIDYETHDGSATAGVDYIGMTGTVEWAAGETGEKRITLDLVDDAVAEDLETITVVLSNAVGTSLGSRDSASVLIIDDDRNEADGECVPDEETLCLGDDRFALRGTWTNHAGDTGVFRAVPVSDETGLFWFFDEDNMELLVKVLDGCVLNDHHWVFFAATSDVGFTLEVTDLETGAVQTYDHALGSAADAVTDTDAFACSP